MDESKLSILSNQEVEQYITDYLAKHKNVSIEELVMYIDEIGFQKLKEKMEGLVKTGKTKLIIINEEECYYLPELEEYIQRYIKEHPFLTIEGLENYIATLKKEKE